MQILLGAGSDHRKKIWTDGAEAWNGLVKVDFNADHKPDIVHDLTRLPYPFEDNSADEIHMYDTWEHLGQQGDFETFFAQWTELWRILKPGGLFFGISPHWSSPWAWMDPGHTRAAGPEMLIFLHQPNYTERVGKTPMSDYRFCYKADFDLEGCEITENRQFHWVLKAVKPSRITS